MTLRRYWSTARAEPARSSASARRPRSAGSRAGSMSMWSRSPAAARCQSRRRCAQRRETVEHPFGTIKARMGATHFLMKTPAERRRRDGAARARLQPHTGDEHRRQTAPDCSHPRRLKAGKCLQKRNTPSRYPLWPVIGRSDARHRPPATIGDHGRVPTYPFAHTQDP